MRGEGRGEAGGTPAPLRARPCPGESRLLAAPESPPPPIILTPPLDSANISSARRGDKLVPTQKSQQWRCRVRTAGLHGRVASLLLCAAHVALRRKHQPNASGRLGRSSPAHRGEQPARSRGKSSQHGQLAPCRPGTVSPASAWLWEPQPSSPSSQVLVVPASCNIQRHRVRGIPSTAPLH